MMVSKQVIKVIIEAEETISKVAKQAEKAIQDMGNNGKQSMDGINQASRTAQNTMSRMEKFVKTVQTKFDTLRKKGSNAFDKIKQKVGTAVNSIGKITNVSRTASQAMERIKGVSDSVKNKFNSLKSSVSSFGSSSKKSFQEVSDSEKKLITPLQEIGTTALTTTSKIDDGFIDVKATVMDTETRFTKLKTTIDNFSSEARSRISSAFSGASETVKGKLNSIRVSINKAKAELNQFNTGARGAGSGLGFLRTAASMTVGMIGYDLVNSIVQSTRESINAEANFQAFGKRLKGMSDSDLKTFSSSVDKMQSQFKKVDMKAVGASALEMGVKLQLPKESMEELTKTTAVMSSAFVKEGRTQTDAILAVSDAMDGQFRRLQELGISQEILKNNGWDGDIENKTSLLQAMNKTLDEMGFTETASQINTLDDAYAAISVSGGQLLKSVLVPMTPYIVSIANAAYDASVKLQGFIKAMQDAWDNMPDWQKAALLITGVGLAVSALALAIKFNLIPGVIGSALSFVTAEASSFLWMVTNYGLTTSLGLLATAIWTAVSAVLAFVAPILVAVVVIGALVFAIYEVGKAFGWWTDVGSMLEAIKNNIGRLWDAFINHPDVQAVIQGIGAAWQWLNDLLKPVVDWLKGIWDEIFPESAKGKVDGTRIIIDAIGNAFTFLTTPIRLVYAVLQLLYPYLEQFYNNVLVPLGGFLQSAFAPVWQLIQSILAQIAPMVLSVANAFTMFLNGQMSLPGLIQNIMTNLWNIYITIFSSIGNAIIRWGVKMISNGVNAAVRFVSGIVNRIASLPGRVATYLYNVIGRILSAGSSWVINGVSVASRMVNGVINNVRQLPGKVYTEFMNIGSRIVSAGSDLVNKAKNIGKNIVDGLLGAMGIHSPGIIQEKVVTEFKNTVGRVADWIKPAGETAKEMGETIVDEFGNPTLAADTSLVNDLDAPDMNMNIGVDTSQLTRANSDVISQYDNLASMTGLSLQDMVSQDKNAFASINANDTTQMSNITSIVGNKMSQMTKNVSTNMDSIVAKNKQGFTNAKNNTTTQLNNMVSKTKSANSKMISSWKSMSNDVISFAGKIKNQSSKHFDDLGSRIGKFYRKLQNPGGFGAGPGSPSGKVSTVKRSGTNGFRSITNAIRKAQLPQYMSIGEIRRNPLVSSADVGSYITSGKNNQFKVSDLIQSGNIKIPVGLEDPRNRGAGGWLDNVKGHVNKIKSTANNWSMKGPKIIGKYATNVGFKVKDFVNSVPKIDFQTFKGMAEDVFSQCHYSFYYDSNKYGNWMTAFQHGDMNCSDSSDALIAMAQACGLPASKVHGHWNQFGHFWANIAGHKMDTTGWMNQRNWTPSASHAGPAPKGLTFGEFVDAIKETNESEQQIMNNNEDMEINGKVTVEHIHKFIDLPENISAEEVARLINDAPEDDNWLIKLIKKLVKDKQFQKLDLKEKARWEAKNNRARGV